MEILISNDFDKSVTREKRGQVHNTLDKFIKEIKTHKGDYTKLSKGFRYKKFKNTDVSAIRSNLGYRIILIDLASVKNHREAPNKGILILEFSHHDDQNRKAKRINSKNLANSKQKLTFEDFGDIEEEIKNEPAKFNYDIESKKTIIIPNQKNDKLTNVLKDSAYLYQYLNNEQYEVFAKFDKAILLAGNAGSGKTMIGIQKLNNLKNECDCIYITYTYQLKKKVQDLFSENSSKVKFYDIDTFMNEVLKKDIKKSINFFKFEKWYKEQKSKTFKKYNVLDIWAEIRGTIKGSMLLNWERKKGNLKKIINEKEYLDLPKDYSIFETEARKIIYKEIAKKYQEWLEEENLFDDNDLALDFIEKKEKKQFDYAIIDEVQDFTEAQIYACIELVKDKNKILFSGDTHQIINPTYFDFNRITTLYHSLSKENRDIDYEKKILNYNYRSSEEVVEFTNCITNIRREKIAHKKQAEEVDDEICRSSVLGTIYRVEPATEDNKNKLLEIVATNPYCAVVVTNEKDKKEIADKMGSDAQIYTVSEIKGLEDKYIVCYNILSHSIDKWEEIAEGKKSKRSSKHRYYFNLFYVAITRSTHSLVFYEEKELQENLKQLLFKNISSGEDIDITILGMTEDFNDEDWYNQGKKREKAEQFQRAIAFYKRSKEYKNALHCIKRCEIKDIAKEPGTYETVGDLLFDELDEFEEASTYYEKANCPIKYIDCLINLRKDSESIKKYMSERKITQAKLILNIKKRGFDKILRYFEKRTKYLLKEWKWN